MAGEARSAPGVGKSSEIGPIMGGLRVALRTLSVECCLLQESDPRPRSENTAVNITFVQGGAQEPQSAFLGRGGLEGGRRRPDRRQGLQGLLRGQVLQRFAEQIIEDDKVGTGFNSASRSRTSSVSRRSCGSLAWVWWRRSPL